MPIFEPTKITSLRLRDLPDGQYNAAEMPTGAKNWRRLADSYKEAADRLAGDMKDSYSYALLGAPMMFLYRHYIEIQLKSLLLDAGELFDEPQNVPALHYLVSLWKRVRKWLLRVDPNSDSEYSVRADQVIADFDSIDPNSFTFRYPVGKAGDPSMESNLFIDPRVARQMIAELDILLAGASSMIAEYMGYKHET